MTPRLLPQLEKELSALDPGTTSLVFDFANLEYISSAGLRLVIAAYKKMAGKEGFRIVNVSDRCTMFSALPDLIRRLILRRNK